MGQGGVLVGVDPHGAGGAVRRWVGGVMAGLHGGQLVRAGLCSASTLLTCDGSAARVHLPPRLLQEARAAMGQPRQALIKGGRVSGVVEEICEKTKRGFFPLMRPHFRVRAAPPGHPC